MKYESLMQAVFADPPDSKTIWNGRYKIPWDDPDFSRRMLTEHLSQEHDLASRNKKAITEQVEWIHTILSENVPGKLLDLGCGPGFYIAEFIDRGYDCRGIDFSPLSVEYAKKTVGDGAKLTQGDIRHSDFESGYDIVMMIYGELNVFSPMDCATVLRKAYNALSPGGKLLVEVQAFDAVERVGNAPVSWYKSESGLFSDNPHLCLIENMWFEGQHTALQRFTVIEAPDNTVTSYRSTTKAWTETELKEMLSAAGFVNIAIRPDWPSYNNDLILYTAFKPV